MTIVNYTPDPNNLPQLTEAQEAHLANLTDEQIDYSDIEELDQAFWQKAELATPDFTQPITLQIKRSVLQFFQRNDKKGYQSLINEVLESYVQTHQQD
jgi:uncharacterized protein (DUF4415 family)